MTHVNINKSHTQETHAIKLEDAKYSKNTIRLRGLILKLFPATIIISEEIVNVEQRAVFENRTIVFNASTASLKLLAGAQIRTP